MKTDQRDGTCVGARSRRTPTDLGIANCFPNVSTFRLLESRFQGGTTAPLNGPIKLPYSRLESTFIKITNGFKASKLRARLRGYSAKSSTGRNSAAWKLHVQKLYDIMVLRKYRKCNIQCTSSSWVEVFNQLTAQLPGRVKLTDARVALMSRRLFYIELYREWGSEFLWQCVGTAVYWQSRFSGHERLLCRLGAISLSAGKAKCSLHRTKQHCQPIFRKLQSTFSAGQFSVLVQFSD